MKDYLMKRLKKLQDRKEEIVKAADTCDDVQVAKGYVTEMESLNEEIGEITAELAKLEGTAKSFQPMATYTAAKAVSDEDVAEVEYMKHFKSYVLTGKQIPQDVVKAAAASYTTDIGAVIPNTIMNRIIEKMNVSGNILSRVTKTNYKGGLSIPTATSKPTATWVAEGSVAESQKKEVKGSVVFAYHKLQMVVAVSLEADTTSMAIFQQTIEKNVAEAMVIALEKAIVNGTGSGQPKGILAETIPAERTVEAAEADIGTYKFWAKVESKVPLAYKQGGVYLMGQQTWDEYIAGMVDSNGQPVARVTVGLDGVPAYRLMGREVILNEYMDEFAAATAGKVFACIVKLSDYILNSNLQMSIKRYFDENSDEYRTKATMLADGKMTDTNGVVIVKKKAASGT